jgi:MFS family permease
VSDAERAAPRAARPPGWYRYTWFLGRPPSLTSLQWRVLGLVAAVSFFEQYDLYLFTLNLSQIQAELAIADADLGFLAAFVRAGSLLSIVLLIAADRIGRRRLLLVTILGYTVLTGATALAPDAQTFTLCQCLARAFATAETVLATVVIIEEFDAADRGWGVGALAAMQGCGAGFAALLFGFVDWLPFGWRALYGVGLVPLLFVAHWRRTLPETRRFAALEAARHQGSTLLPGGAEDLAALLRSGRFRAVAAAVLCLALAGAAPTFFAPKFLQEVQGWTPAGVAALTVIGGGLAVVANPLAGRWSDRLGRKPVAASFIAGYVALSITFYNSAGLGLPVVWIGLLFCLMGTDVVVSTSAGELFPTRLRASAAGARALIATAGSVLGLTLVGWLYPVLGSNWLAVSLVATIGLAAVPIVLLALPETAGQPLEAIGDDT